MCCSLPTFDRSKPFSFYVRYSKSPFCISSDDFGDFWVSSLSDDYPSFFIGPYTELDALKSLTTTIEYFNLLEVKKNEK